MLRGTSLVSNIAFQYHISEYFWPEVEFNNTYWFDGARRHPDQLFITLGIVFGRWGNLKGIIGIGYQIALTPSPTILEPALTPIYDHALLLTGCVAF